MNSKEEFKKLVEVIKKQARLQGRKLTNDDIAAKLGYSPNHFNNMMGQRAAVERTHVQLLASKYKEYLDADNQIAEPSETYGHKKAPVSDQGELIELLKQTVKDKQEIIRLNSVLLAERLTALEVRHKAVIVQVSKVRSKLEGAPFENFVDEANKFFLDSIGVNP